MMEDWRKKRKKMQECIKRGKHDERINKTGLQHDRKVIETRKSMID